MESEDRYKLRPRRYLDEYCAGLSRPTRESREWLKKMFGDDWEVWDTLEEEIVYQSQDVEKLEELLQELIK